MSLMKGLEVVEVKKAETRKKGEPLRELYTAKLESEDPELEWVKIRTKDVVLMEVGDRVSLSVDQRQARLSEAEGGGA